MPAVSNLNVKLQSGTANTYFATWDFNEWTKSTVVTGTAMGVGSLVSIASNATYYNGQRMPDWVKNDKWYIKQITGDRAVIDKNESGTHSINSPVNVAYLSGGTQQTSVVDVKTLDHYATEWDYNTGDGIWFVGQKGDTTDKYVTYNAPSNALMVRCWLLPVSTSHDVNGTSTAYWTGTWVYADHSPAGDPPPQMGTPSVEIKKYSLTASLTNIGDYNENGDYNKVDELSFEIYKDDVLYKTGTVTVRLAQGAFTCNVEAGSEYMARVRAINDYYGARIYGAWSDYSSKVGTIPAAPAGITSCKATSKTSIQIRWSGVKSATSYDVEYATKRSYFDYTNQTSTKTGIKTTQFEFVGLEAGNEYFFRVRAVNDKGESEWTDIISVVIGTKPAAPTTWSSSATVITGEPLKLYWIHNAEDGSKWKYAELEITADGKKVATNPDPIKNTKTEDEADTTAFYSIDTSIYKEGTVIDWRARTCGITNEYGDWSVMRRVNIYAPATLSLSIRNKDNNPTEVITQFPFYIYGLPGPKTQAPISYHVAIAAANNYTTVDQIGQTKVVNAGEEVYFKNFDTSEALLVEMSANNIDLENNQDYIVTVVVSMNSGLTATATANISVNWIESKYEPDAEIGIDETSYSAYVRPYCIDANGDPAQNVTLAVYRRTYDGDFVKIADNIECNRNIHVTDPHPALDYARYRIIATEISTGAVSFYDPPGYPINGPAIILQWDEEWSSFDTNNSDKMVEPPWAGSMLQLMYNVDVTENTDPDVELVSYTGRENPVSYYGTQIGTSATWNTDVCKSDKETIYQLRRIQRWRGDVYVREPSGVGFWANIKVSFSQKHCNDLVPVTLTITRVEGDM